VIYNDEASPLEPGWACSGSDTAWRWKKWGCCGALQELAYKIETRGPDRLIRKLSVDIKILIHGSRVLRGLVNAHLAGMEALGGCCDMILVVIDHWW